MRLSFVLPASPGGGGAHSIVQESSELAALGVDVRLVVKAQDLVSFRCYYGASLSPRLAISSYETAPDIVRAISGSDFVVATTYGSVRLITDAMGIVAGARVPRLAYYVQDYEPFFCTPGSEEWIEARESYTLGEGTLLFAKTRWLCEQVALLHRCRVHKVEPSVDHQIFRPDLAGTRGKVAVCAMVRPSTPRRAPARTMRVLSWIVEEREGVEVHAFGCDASALDALDVTRHPDVRFHGELAREQVAQVLRSCDFFLDLSDYQAFGRTGVEAMASGCVPVMPSLGAAPELVTDSIDGFIVDTSNELAVFEAVSVALGLSESERHGMKSAALERASAFSLRRAAVSEYRLFADALYDG